MSDSKTEEKCQKPIEDKEQCLNDENRPAEEKPEQKMIKEYEQNTAIAGKNNNYAPGGPVGYFAGPAFGDLEWQHGFLGCMDDMGTCLMSWCVPCVVVGMNAKAHGENPWVWGGGCVILELLGGWGGCLVGFQYNKLRTLYGIRGSIVTDLVKGWCCSCCAMAQCAQEIQAHGGPKPMTMARE